MLSCVVLGLLLPIKNVYVLKTIMASWTELDVSSLAHTFPWCSLDSIKDKTTTKRNVQDEARPSRSISSNTLNHSNDAETRPKITEGKLSTVKQTFRNFRKRSPIFKQNASPSKENGFEGNDLNANEVIQNLTGNHGIIKDTVPKHKRFGCVQTRILSIENVCSTKMFNFTKHEIKSIAECGFYYKSSQKKLTCVCFHCDARFTISEIEDNMCDLWRLHVLKQPYCAHVRQIKGDAFVIDVLRYNQKSSDEICAETGMQVLSDETEVRLRHRVCGINSTVGINGPRDKEGEIISSMQEVRLQHNKGDMNLTEKEERLSDEEPDDKCEETDEEYLLTEIRTLEDERKELYEQDMCKVCYDFKSSILTLPCSHIAVCGYCISALDHCPVCRSKVKCTIRVIMN